MSRLWYFQPVRRQQRAFEAGYIERLRDAILTSPYLSTSTLNERFATTRGFSVTFQRSGLAHVQKVFPIFAPYLERVMERRSNAFFLNPLVLGKGNYVSPHVDCSLRSYTRPLEPPCPSKVSVLYVDVPQPFEGGWLILHRAREVARLVPESNLLIEFQGYLKHEVTAVERCGTESSPAARISLVCEHYRLPPKLLEMIPEFYLNSKRKFEDFLGEALGGQTPEDLEAEADEEAPVIESPEGPPSRGAAGGVPEGPPSRGAAGGVPEGSAQGETAAEAG